MCISAENHTATVPSASKVNIMLSAQPPVTALARLYYYTPTECCNLIGQLLWNIYWCFTPTCEHARKSILNDKETILSLLLFHSTSTAVCTTMHPRCTRGCINLCLRSKIQTTRASYNLIFFSTITPTFVTHFCLPQLALLS